MDIFASSNSTNETSHHEGILRSGRTAPYSTAWRLFQCGSVTEHIPPEAYSLAGQEIIILLRKPKVSSTCSQKPATGSYHVPFFTILRSIIHPFTTKSSKLSLSFRCSTQMFFLENSHLAHTCFLTGPSNTVFSSFALLIPPSGSYGLLGVTDVKKLPRKLYLKLLKCLT